MILLIISVLYFLCNFFYKKSSKKFWLCRKKIVTLHQFFKGVGRL
ncbi:hypothetical protein HMPREF9074_08665 [Capnocytophaga sp. oral taxon 329 str. F0087]|nr:hypothetical protein HMPREF9074_08665 [Capnocytophaga sp. oral taxon 329 str. F0087]